MKKVNNSWITTCIYFSTQIMFVCCYDLELSQNFCVSPSASVVAANETSENVLELVPANTGDRIELQCKPCGMEERSVSPRLWYQRDVAQQKTWHELELGMDAPLTANRVYTTSKHSLVIQDFQPQHDAGRYWCRGLEGDDPDFMIAYLLEELLPLNVSEPYIFGNMSLWPRFESQLAPLGEALDKLAGVESPDVTMHWSSWGPCEDCESTGLGERARRGRCIAVTPVHLHLLPYNLTSVSCRSLLLRELNISASVQQQFVSVPDFVMYEQCECVHQDMTVAEKSLELHHKLKEGDNLNLVCPGASAHELVQWKRGLEVLSSGVWLPQGKLGRIRVDALGTLHIQHAELPVAGHYTCRASKQTWRFLIEVEQLFVLASEEFQRDIKYVLAMLFLCLLLYFAYLSLLCCEAPEVRHKIMFGTPLSSAISNPLESEDSDTPRQVSVIDLELNLMESGSQVSGGSESEGEPPSNVVTDVVPSVSELEERPRLSIIAEEENLQFSEAEKSDPNKPLLY